MKKNKNKNKKSPMHPKQRDDKHATDELELVCAVY